MHEEDFIHEKGKIIAMALATTLFIAAHTIPVSAAENTCDILPQTTLAEGIAPLFESAYYVTPSILISGSLIHSIKIERLSGFRYFIDKSMVVLRKRKIMIDFIHR